MGILRPIQEVPCQGDKITGPLEHDPETVEAVEGKGPGTPGFDDTPA